MSPAAQATNVAKVWPASTLLVRLPRCVRTHVEASSLCQQDLLGCPARCVAGRRQRRRQRCRRAAEAAAGNCGGKAGALQLLHRDRRGDWCWSGAVRRQRRILRVGLGHQAGNRRGADAAGRCAPHLAGYAGCAAHRPAAGPRGPRSDARAVWSTGGLNHARAPARHEVWDPRLRHSDALPAATHRRVSQGRLRSAGSRALVSGAPLSSSPRTCSPPV